MASGGTALQKRRRRIAGVVGLSLLAHGALLLIIGSQVPQSRWRVPALDQDTLRIELTRPPAPPRPVTPTAAAKPLRAEPPRPASPAPLVPHLTPPSPAAPPAVAAPAPAKPSPWQVGPGPLLPGFSSALRTTTGCSDPNQAGLSKLEREKCKARLAQGARDAPFIPAPIAPEKRAAFDQALKCRRDYYDAGVPSGTEVSGYGAGQMSGLGYIPRTKECGPKSQ